MDQAVAVLHPVQDLTVIPTDIRLRVFTEPGAIEPWLDHVRKSVADFKPDLTTARGRANIKSIAFEVTKSKTYLTKVGKELADEQKAIPKLIDATRKHITDTLEALATEVRKPLTDWEIGDEQRVQGHRHAIQNFAILSETKGSNGGDLSAEQLRFNLAMIDAMPIDAEHCEEFLSEYERAKHAAVAILNVLIPAREAAEADRAELIQLRADAKARNERDAFEAELLEKAAIEKAAAERAAAWKIESERLAAEAAAQLVRDTEARLAREAQEAAARR
jgi:colicin import membrane protein